MKKVAAKIALVLVAISACSEASAGEDLDRLDIEASYCEGSAQYTLEYWQADTENPTFRKLIIDEFQKELFTVTQYLAARGKGHVNAIAITKGMLDAKTCHDALARDSAQCEAACGKCKGEACQAPQYRQCLNANPECSAAKLKSTECKKTAACGTLSERLPM
jgi:hypothetical protein